MSFEDNQIKTNIRHVLTSAWVDITKVLVRVTGGSAYLSGTLQRMTQEHQELLPSQLKRLDLSIRSLRGVRGVYYNFNNWTYSVYGTWSPVDNNQKAAIDITEPAPPPSAEPTPPAPPSNLSG